MELYRIWYQTHEGCLPKYQLAITPYIAQREFYLENPDKTIVAIEHMGKKVIIKCKVRDKEELFKND